MKLENMNKALEEIKDIFKVQLEKAKVPIGTVHQWGGKPYQKRGESDWVEVKKPEVEKKPEKKEEVKKPEAEKKSEEKKETKGAIVEKGERLVLTKEINGTNQQHASDSDFDEGTEIEVVSVNKNKGFAIVVDVDHPEEEFGMDLEELRSGSKNLEPKEKKVKETPEKKRAVKLKHLKWAVKLFQDAVDEDKRNKEQNITPRWKRASPEKQIKFLEEAKKKLKDFESKQ